MGTDSAGRCLIKSFSKMHFEVLKSIVGAGQHGTGGLIDVVQTEMTFDEDLWFSAGQELGYDVRIDPNGPQKVGFATAEYNRNRGRRVSTFTAYLEPILGKRKNLVVRKYSLVSHVSHKLGNLLLTALWISLVISELFSG